MPREVADVAKVGCGVKSLSRVSGDDVRLGKAQVAPGIQRCHVTRYAVHRASRWIAVLCELMWIRGTLLPGVESG